MKFAILTFGCRVNQAESLAIEDGLRAAGAHPAPPAEADVIIINSCSVTSTADQGTRQAIRRAARTNPQARLVVTGCYATRRPDEIAALPGVARVIANPAKDALAGIVADAYGEGRLTTRDRFAPEGDGPCGLKVAPGAAGRTAFTLRVQTGCDERCSYCIIPQTRGPSTSRPLQWILEQIERACAVGYKEITLTGVHLGAYGRDLRPRRSLVDLLAGVARLPLDALVRLGSLEPMDCTDAVVDLVATSPTLAPAFHLPLQHASGAVLQRMRRPYTADRYSALLHDIRRRLPDAAIGSDIIAGFPGESADDFAVLKRFLEGSTLTLLHVFPYSDRPGTEASQMSPRTEPPTVRERARVLRETGRRLTERFIDTQVGALRRALVIDDGWSVVTANGLRARLCQRRQRNEWIEVRLRLESDGLVADLGTPLQACSSVAAC